MKDFVKNYILALLCLTIIEFFTLLLFLYFDSANSQAGHLTLAFTLIIGVILVHFVGNLICFFIIALPIFAFIRKFSHFNYFWAIAIGLLAGNINYAFISQNYGWAEEIPYSWFLGLGFLLGNLLAYFDFRLQKRQKKSAENVQTIFR